MADQVVVADNVELVANNIQNKVGSTLIGLRGTAKATTDNQSEGATGVLQTIKILQTQAVEKLTEIWEVLAGQLKFDENEARRLREERNDPKNRGKGGVGATPAMGDTAGKLGQNEGEGLIGWIKNNPFLSALFITGVGGMAIAAKGLLVKFGGTLLRGGFYAIVAKMLGDGIVKAIGAEEGSMSEQAFSKYIPMSIFGFMMTKSLPGALIAVAATGLQSVIEYVSGHKTFQEVSGFDWGAASLSGVAATYGLGTVLMGLGAKGGAVATLGAALAAWPVVLTVGIGVALGVGIRWLSGKVDEYKGKVLDDLEKFGQTTQEEFEKRLADQKSHWFTRMFPSLAGTMGMSLTDMQKANITSGDIRKNLETGKEVDPRNANIIEGVADKLLAMSDQGLKEVLSDKHRASEHIDFMRDLEYMIQEQIFGPEKSAELYKMLQDHKNQIQRQAMSIKTDNDKVGAKTALYLDNILHGRGKRSEGALYEMEALNKMNFKDRYDEVKGFDDVKAERDEFGASLNLKQGQIDYSERKRPKGISDDDWAKLQAMNKEVVKMRDMKEKLELDVSRRLGTDFDYEKRIQLLGLDNFLDLYYKALDVQIKKINKQMILKDNSGESASHPVFQANNLNNAKSVNNAVMFHPSWGTDGSEGATKPWERNWMTQR